MCGGGGGHQERQCRVEEADWHIRLREQCKVCVGGIQDEKRLHQGGIDSRSLSRLTPATEQLITLKNQ